MIAISPCLEHGEQIDGVHDTIFVEVSDMNRIVVLEEHDDIFEFIDEHEVEVEVIVDIEAEGA